MNKEMVKVTIEVRGQEKQVITGANIMGVVSDQVNAEQTQIIIMGEFNPMGMGIQLKDAVAGVVESLAKNGMPKPVIVEMITTMVVYGMGEAFENEKVDENAADELLGLLNLMKKAAR